MNLWRWLLLLLSGCASVGSIASPPLKLLEPLGSGETLAFYHSDIITGSHDLYLLDDVNGIRQVTQSERYAVSPAWSPDGSSLVYKVGYSWESDYFLIDANGSNRRQITSDNHYKHVPRWSPDGEYLAYWASARSGDPTTSPFYLTITQVETGATHQLALALTGVENFVWTLDSQGLFVIAREGDTITASVYNLDGTFNYSVSEAGFLRDSFPIALSPDARRVAYALPNPDANALTDPIYIASIDGTDARQVGTLWLDGAIIWSPDSTKLAFTTLTADNQDALYVVDSDGANQRLLMTLNTGDDTGEILPAAPAWSSDGKRIAISSFISDAGFAIFVMNADGSDRRQVTTASGLIYDLAWRP